MPLLIPARLAASPIHGLGLFTEVPVAAGTPMWVFDDRIDRIVAPGDAVLTDYPGVARLADSHGCVIGGLGILMLGDDARFVNHAEEPVMGRADPGDWRRFHALRDLAIGEEITCNYEEICEDVRGAGAVHYLSGEGR